MVKCHSFHKLFLGRQYSQNIADVEASTTQTMILVTTSCKLLHRRLFASTVQAHVYRGASRTLLPCYRRLSPMVQATPVGHSRCGPSTCHRRPFTSPPSSLSNSRCSMIGTESAASPSSGASGLSDVPMSPEPCTPSEALRPDSIVATSPAHCHKGSEFGAESGPRTHADGSQLLHHSSLSDPEAANDSSAFHTEIPTSHIRDDSSLGKPTVLRPASPQAEKLGASGCGSEFPPDVGVFVVDRSAERSKVDTFEKAGFSPAVDSAETWPKDNPREEALAATLEDSQPHSCNATHADFADLGRVTVREATGSRKAVHTGESAVKVRVVSTLGVTSARQDFRQATLTTVNAIPVGAFAIMQQQQVIMTLLSSRLGVWRIARSMLFRPRSGLLLKIFLAQEKPLIEVVGQPAEPGLVTCSPSVGRPLSKRHRKTRRRRQLRMFAVAGPSSRGVSASLHMTSNLSPEPAQAGSAASSFASDSPRQAETLARDPMAGPPLSIRPPDPPKAEAEPQHINERQETEPGQVPPQTKVEGHSTIASQFISPPEIIGDPKQMPSQESEQPRSFESDVSSEFDMFTESSIEAQIGASGEDRAPSMSGSEMRPKETAGPSTDESAMLHELGFHDSPQTETLGRREVEDMADGSQLNISSFDLNPSSDLLRNYEGVLQLVLADGVADLETKRFLTEYQRRCGISVEQHAEALRRLGWSLEEYVAGVLTAKASGTSRWQTWKNAFLESAEKHGNYIVTIGSLSSLTSIMMSNMAHLRVLQLFAGFLYFAYNMTRRPPLVSAAYWNLVFFAINSFMLLFLFLERRPATFTNEEMDVFDRYFLSCGLSPRAFRQLLALAEWRRIPSGRVIIREGETMKDLMILCKGTLSLTSNGTEVDQLEEGDRDAILGVKTFLTQLQGTDRDYKNGRAADGESENVSAPASAAPPRKQNASVVRNVDQNKVAALHGPAAVVPRKSAQPTTTMSASVLPPTNGRSVVSEAEPAAEADARDVRAPLVGSSSFLTPSSEPRQEPASFALDWRNVDSSDCAPSSTSVVSTGDVILLCWPIERLVSLAKADPVHIGFPLVGGMARAAIIKSRNQSARQKLASYEIVLQAVLADGQVNVEERKLLEGCRVKFDVSDEQHWELVNRLGWTREEFEDSHRGPAVLQTASKAFRAIAATLRNE